VAETTETHYVARLVVERVDKVRFQDHPSKEPTYSRDVSEVANFTVKSDDLETLKGRIQNHVGLVDE
jgi:hypothetical protein